MLNTKTKTETKINTEIEKNERRQRQRQNIKTQTEREEEPCRPTNQNIKKYEKKTDQKTQRENAKLYLPL